MRRPIGQEVGGNDVVVRWLREEEVAQEPGVQQVAFEFGENSSFFVFW
jgi:hypothetical protein